jgi:hypothetical protein
MQRLVPELMLRFGRFCCYSSSPHDRTSIGYGSDKFRSCAAGSDFNG